LHFQTVGERRVEEQKQEGKNCEPIFEIVIQAHQEAFGFLQILFFPNPQSVFVDLGVNESSSQSIPKRQLESSFSLEDKLPQTYKYTSTTPPV
jgi:hypothetical protein